MLSMAIVVLYSSPATNKPMNSSNVVEGKKSEKKNPPGLHHCLVLFPIFLWKIVILVHPQLPQNYPKLIFSFGGPRRQLSCLLSESTSAGDEGHPIIDP